MNFESGSSGLHACGWLLSGMLVLAACGDDTSSDGAGDEDGGALVVADAGNPGDSSDAGAPPDEGPRPPTKFLPAPTATCPGFEEGDGCEDDGTSLVCTFEPEGVPARKVRVWLGDGARKGGGALVFYWHGLTRNAADAVIAGAGLGPDTLEDMLDAGAVLASPEQEDGRATGFTALPWISAAAAGYGEGDNKFDDFLVMDEVVACAIEKLDIDVRHIHSTGMSAGGLQTGQVIVQRSGYLASAVTFSGGIGGAPVVQDVKNKLPVMIFWGGAADMVFINFETMALGMRKRFDANGQFSILCNHGMGHLVPLDGGAAAWRFFQDHPFGTNPSPYAKKLPGFLPDYCSLDAPMP